MSLSMDNQILSYLLNLNHLNFLYFIHIILYNSIHHFLLFNQNIEHDMDQMLNMYVYISMDFYL